MGLPFKIAANTLYQLIGKLITAGITFLVTILIARQFGSTGFGEFTKITTYVAFFYLIVDFGLNAIVLKQISNLKSQNSKPNLKTQNYFGNLLSLRIFFSLVLIFLALAILICLPFNTVTFQGFTPLSRLGIIILAPTILTQAIFLTSNLIFQKNLRYDKSVVAACLGSLTTFLLIIFLVRIKTGLLMIVGSYLIGGVVMAGASLFLVNQLTIGNYQLAINPIFWRRLLSQSFPLGLTLIFNLIYFRADVLILTFFRSTEEVGIYGLAYKFFEFPLALPTFFMNAVYPVLLNSKSKRQKSKIIKKSGVFLFLASAFLLLASFTLAPLLAFIKQDFVASVTPFRILTLSLPLFFLTSLFMWVLIAQGKQRLLAKIYGLGMIINIFLNLLFIPRFGYNAAAVITGFSEGIVLLLLVSKTIKQNKYGN